MIFRQEALGSATLIDKTVWKGRNPICRQYFHEEIQASQEQNCSVLCPGAESLHGECFLFCAKFDPLTLEQWVKRTLSRYFLIIMINLNQVAPLREHSNFLLNRTSSTLEFPLNLRVT